MSAKTEQPTRKRIEKAHAAGDSGVSAFFAQSVGFLATTGLLSFFLVRAASTLVVGLKSALRSAATLDPTTIPFEPWTVVRDVLEASVPLLACAALAGAISALLQTGGGVAVKRLVPDIGRLNPMSGLLRLSSGERLFVVVRASVFALSVAVIGTQAIKTHLEDIGHTAGRPAAVGTLAAEILRSVLVSTAAVGVTFGVFDLLVTRAAWRRRLRMSKDELKREQKENDGDPTIHDARKRTRHELLSTLEAP